MTQTKAAKNAPVSFLPQDELLTLNVNDIPILKDGAGPGISFQPLMIDAEAGVWVVMGIFAPGITMPTHLHTGSVHGYTLKGSWFYSEYPDQVQVPGSYLYEPASSMHTFEVPATNTEDTVVLFIVHGSNIGFTDDGQFHSTLDAATVLDLIKMWTGANKGVKVPYISGGKAHAIEG
ncbi:2,4'-dihydroxyacetophenone dioxygenase [Novosphingobium sediminis]|uniref:2,4'-dihydroxyacetophenone dioxygenase n=1 Tax=Novosphingobium sediminis TaxID=707214 RepID=A0A512AP98_9SPHN|nr:2,4'-dihydroxyacetophenone dioxygenase family protein [Novosphingobium sediminis]GEO01528.1 2,4'-dihydroxyacetophenone dioxygenase [Novosphingobium sediminis]